MRMLLLCAGLWFASVAGAAGSCGAAVRRLLENTPSMILKRSADRVAKSVRSSPGPRNLEALLLQIPGHGLEPSPRLPGEQGSRDLIE